MLKEIQNNKKRIKKASALDKGVDNIISELFNSTKEENDKQLEKIKDLESKCEQKNIEEVLYEDKFKEKYLKARNKTRDLFGKHIDNLRLKNELKEQRDKIERQKQKIELSYKRARSRTIDLYGKHVDLKKAKKRIELQQDELINSNALLEKKNKEVRDSIDYAKKIQDAILPSQETIKQYINNFFILLKPKDIISGDFFWFHKKEDKLFFAVADCTGHGVPGALMSMMGTTILNNIITDDNFQNPASILCELNKRIIIALKQDVPDSEQSDGMEISLCSINLKKKEFTLASAGQDTYLISDDNLFSIESDLFSVGGNISSRIKAEYTNHHFPIEKESSLYLLSDGFKDQFGGDKNKKFGVKQLKEILLNIHKSSFSQQKEELNKQFMTWKGSQKQIDDVLVVGIDLNSILETNTK